MALRSSLVQKIMHIIGYDYDHDANFKKITMSDFSDLKD